eukprot:1300994-Ditylum_brightwellii.AAC.1
MDCRTGQDRYIPRGLNDEQSPCTAQGRKYHNSELVFDPTHQEVDEQAFERKDWTSSEYGHVSGNEELPPNMPTPQGFGFK